MKIGFYGDSYCVDLDRSNASEDWPAYCTNLYLDLIRQKYNAKMVNSGNGGSSIWDVFLKQFDYNNVPDICIFCWTLSNRLYHPIHRGQMTSRPKAQKIDYNLGNAVDYYYKHLYIKEKVQLETTAAFYWFDNEILSKLKDKKIIHLWSIGEREESSESFDYWADANNHQPDKIKYFYRWKNGVEIQPALYALSVQGNTIEQNLSYYLKETRLNHLEPHKHHMLASWIEKALDRYQNGLLLDFSNDIKL